mgnify:CR=1 FL=1
MGGWSGSGSGGVGVGGGGIVGGGICGWILALVPAVSPVVRLTCLQRTSRGVCGEWIQKDRLRDFLE